MDVAKINEWAARYIGEDEDLIPDVVESQWYTTSPGAALVLLHKCAKEGCEIELEVEDGEVEVKCDEAVETGTMDEFALLVTRACYRCRNG